MTQDPDMEGLVSPDEDGDDAKYGWDVEFQRHIIALLMVDQQFLVQSMDLIKPSYFSNKAHRETCKILFRLFKEYRMLPKRSFLMQELRDELKADKAKLAHVGEITSLYDYFEPGLEARQYLSDKILFFAKIQAAKEAANKMFKELEKAPESEETWSKICDIWKKALNTDRNYDIGLKYFESIKERYERMREEDNSTEIFVVGKEGIDKEIKGGGYKRGEMITIIGGSGVGKSVELTCIAAENIKRGKKCAYISLELSEDRVAERFDSILTGANIHCLYDQKDEIFSTLEEMVEDKKDKNLIVIKHFPGKSADVNTIRAYVQQLKFNGFVPDILIVDYIGEMKFPVAVPKHEAMEVAVAELRGLADEEQVFLATAMQPNRGSKEAQKAGRIEEEHLADSFGQIRPVDGAFSLNQNESEKAVQLGRMFVIKQRFGKSRYQIYIHFDPVSLKITEISQDTYKKRLNSRSEKVSDEVAIDMVVKEYKPSDAEEDAETGELK